MLIHNIYYHKHYYFFNIKVCKLLKIFVNWKVKNNIKPMVLDKIYRFLEKNIQIISDYSDRKISTKDLIEGIKKV